MAFSPKIRGRCWMATIHIKNMEKAGLTKDRYEKPEFLAAYMINLWEGSGAGRSAGIAVCVSQDGCYHAHMACYGNTTTLKKVSDTLFQSHVEPQLGGKEQLTAYLMKEGEYAEKGEQVLYTTGLDVIEDNQGSRNIFDKIEEILKSGYTPQQIFDLSLKYRKYEKLIKAQYLQLLIKNTPLTKKMFNEYHFGPSGSGKTFTYIRMCEKYGADDVYLCNDYSNSGSSGGGFDLYSENPAKIIFLDEFRGSLPYNTLLSILDVYSRNQVHARYQNIFCLWTSVIISSILSPEELYKRMVDYDYRKSDSMNQLIRRLNIIVYHWKGLDGHYKTYTIPASEYRSKTQLIEKAMEFDQIDYADYKKQHMNDAETDDSDEAKIFEGGAILD